MTNTIHGVLSFSELPFLKPYDSSVLNFILMKVYSDILTDGECYTVRFVSENVQTGEKLRLPCFHVPIPYINAQIAKTIPPGDSDQYANYFLGLILPGFTPVSLTLKYADCINYISLFINSVLDAIRIEQSYVFASTRDFRFFVHKNMIPNPFDQGNPSPACYTTNRRCHHEQQSLITRVIPYTSDPVFQEMKIYVLDKQTSQSGYAGEEITSGCLKTYLLCPNGPSNVFPGVETPPFPYGYMRIELPTVYTTTSPCKNNPDYDLLYFSVSSEFNTRDTVTDPTRYWSVNYRMMKKFTSVSTDKRIAYVFWSPRAMLFVPPNSSVPGVVEWGNRKGTILGTPGTLFFRLKQPNARLSAFLGSLPCYDTPEQNQPQTIPWIKVYGSMTNFLQL